MCHSYQCATGNLKKGNGGEGAGGGESFRGRAFGERIPELPLGSGSDRKRALAENGPAKRVFPSISGSREMDVIHCCARRKERGEKRGERRAGEEGRRSLPRKHLDL